MLGTSDEIPKVFSECNFADNIETVKHGPFSNVDGLAGAVLHLFSQNIGLFFDTFLIGCKGCLMLAKCCNGSLLR